MDPIKLSLIALIFCMHIILWADNGCVINTLKQPMFPVTRFLGLRDNVDSL